MLIQAAPGAFAAPVPYPAGQQLFDLAAADLDGDAYLDLAAPRSKQVLCLLNDGRGAFKTGPASAVESFSSAVASGDLDGDGDLALGYGDFASCDPSECEHAPGAISILLNDGKASFASVAKHRLFHTPFDLAASDVDLDGDQDLIAPLFHWDETDNEHAGTDVMVLTHAGGAFTPWGSTFVGREPRSVAAQDLTGDGFPEVIALTRDGLAVLRNVTRPPASRDLDRDGVPDECGEAGFRRGDWNGDGELQLTDPVALLEYAFRGGEESSCLKAGDADDNGRLEITDAVRVLAYLFLGGQAPLPPFVDCGADPTPDALRCVRVPACE